MRPEDILEGDGGKALLAGAAGGIVRWVTLRSNWKEGIGAILVGALCALYLGPIAQPILEPVIGKIAPNGDATGFAAFFVGLGGISLSGLLIDIIAARLPKGRQDNDGS